MPRLIPSTLDENPNILAAAAVARHQEALPTAVYADVPAVVAAASKQHLSDDVAEPCYYPDHPEEEEEHEEHQGYHHEEDEHEVIEGHEDVEDHEEVAEEDEGVEEHEEVVGEDDEDEAEQEIIEEEQQEEQQEEQEQEQEQEEEEEEEEQEEEDGDGFESSAPRPYAAADEDAMVEQLIANATATNAAASDEILKMASEECSLLAEALREHNNNNNNNMVAGHYHGNENDYEYNEEEEGDEEEDEEDDYPVEEDDYPVEEEEEMEEMEEMESGKEDEDGFELEEEEEEEEEDVDDNEDEQGRVLMMASDVEQSGVVPTTSDDVPTLGSASTSATDDPRAVAASREPPDAHVTGAGSSAASAANKKWEENFAKLEIFRRENGHCRIMQSMTDRSLYSWINRQRHLYKEFRAGRRVSLTRDKIERLDALGFVWNVYDSKRRRAADDEGDGKRPRTENEDWNERFEELKVYKVLHGDTRVPQGSGAHPGLADWVARQRNAHRELEIRVERGRPLTDPSAATSASALTLERIVRLNSIGFVWERERVRGVWERRFEELRRYRGRYGDCNVREKDADNVDTPNARLARWVHAQRRQYARRAAGKRSHITDRRVRDLESLGFDWENRTRADTWQDRFEELAKYREEHGHCNVPLRYAPNPKLSFWVRTQREQYRQMLLRRRPSNMTEERRQKLESIGFVWALKKCRGPNARWEDRYAELRAVMETHGHAKGSVVNAKLANWITSQRKQRNLLLSGRPSSINRERVEALDAIGFEWVVREPQRREDRLQELREYKEEFGNCMVPKRWARNRRLGQWVAEQRKQYRYLMAGKPSHMTPERVVELETMGFVWSLQFTPQVHKPSAGVNPALMTTAPMTTTTTTTTAATVPTASTPPPNAVQV